MSVTRYRPRSVLLRKLIRFFWTADAEGSLPSDGTLLPVCNIDLVLNLSSRVAYDWGDGSPCVMDGFHFTGLRDRWCSIRRDGPADIVGIAFRPAGAYPLLRRPLADFANATVALSLAARRLEDELGGRLSAVRGIGERLRVIEQTLLRHVDPALLPEPWLTAAADRLAACRGAGSVGGYCEARGIPRRRLERRFATYVGIPPKTFLRLARFRSIVGRMKRGERASLTELAYEHEYFDQAHFLRDFKALAGCPPSRFAAGQPFGRK